MASLYRKKGTAYWYMQWRGKDGKLHNRSTNFRADSAEQTQKAWSLRAEFEKQEKGVPKIQTGERWDAWVPAWLTARYARSPLTKIRYGAAWTALAAYFKEVGARSARVLTREHCMNYIAWRTAPRAKDGEEAVGAEKAGLRKCVHNTALLELKLLSAILREAVARDMAPVNVCLQLGIGRSRTKVKPELSDEEVTRIEVALQDEKDRPYNAAMRASWQIAMLQVCRLTETCVPLVDVNLEEQTITFRIKGGRDHTAMLHPELVPFFTERKAVAGATHAYEMPRHFAKKWWQFFKRHEMQHLSFHSTRVTGVTRLRRQGVDERVAMDFVGHASVLIHRIYQRGKKTEQATAIAALSRRPPSGGSTESSEKTDSPPTT